MEEGSETADRLRIGRENEVPKAAVPLLVARIL
jgi:hypothetical protein